MKKKYLNKKRLFFVIIITIHFILFLKSQNLQAQTVQTFTTSGSWTCPSGVTSIDIKAWGGGGGGGFATTTNRGAGGGGGGGAYRSSNSVAVTAGTTYYYTVGSGGSGGTTTGTAATSGGLSCFSTAINCGGTIITSASGGGAGGSVTTNTAGTSGSGGNTGVFTSASFNGGNGSIGLNGNSASNGGGGGGGGAGTTANGSSATSSKTGGTGGTIGGGNGGNGGDNATGGGGTSIGGGGAGGHKSNTNRAGGAGASGQIQISYAGYCSYATTSTSYWINSVTTTNGFSNINNPTTYSAGGYGDFSTTAIVSQSASANFNFNVTTSSGTHGINIWVDWNNNYIFDASEKVYASGASYVASASGTITIPALTAVGNYRMRIVAHYLNINPPACGTETYTEAEDYTVQVTSPPTCYSPTTLSANANSTTTGNATWSAPILGTTPTGYQYVISTSNVLPTVAGTPVAVTNTSFSGLTPNTNYYVFVRSSCGGGDFSSWVGSSFFTGYCSSTSSSGSYFTDDFSTSGGIANIVNNTSGYSTGGYGNFSAQVVSQVAAGTISFSAVFSGGTVGFNIWVDWNNDLDFNDLGEKVYASTTYVSSAIGTFIVPTTALLGNYRMRIVADGFNTNPSACGSSSSSETEDYTFTVAAPLPCSGNPSTVNVFIVSGTASTVSWTAGIPAPSSGYQYILGTTNVFPSLSDIPTGSVVAGITSIALTGLTAGTTYYFWVKANCTASSTGTGVWIGTTIFTQPTCAIGSGTGTTTLACPATISGGLGLSGAPAPAINCASSGCANLEVTFTPIKQTTSYTVASIPYAPPYQFNCMRNPVSVNIDDRWSPIITLPFNFCFYGNTYNKCLVGSNGVITFDTTANSPGGTNAWAISNNLPTTSLALNSIFGVYHDIDPSVAGGEVGYELITLNTGCRALVATWNNIAMFSSTCNSQKYTGMIVLYENTNIIDVYVKEKNICSTWNDGNAIIGIQNVNGTIATVATNRNGLSTDWSVPTATPEAWRFTPVGSNVPTTIKWYEGSGTTGIVVGTTASVNVCPTINTIYTAEVTYTLCSGLSFSNTAQTPVTVTINKVWNGSVNTDWNGANNWSPNVLPSASESVSIPNVTNKPVIGSGVNALACSISIANGSSLTINSNNNIIVTNAVNAGIGGTLILENDASLIQINNVANTGTIIYNRIAPNIKGSDYVYWSSPVASQNINTIYTTPIQGSKYLWNTIGANANGGLGNWNDSTGVTMTAGQGYIVRGSSNYGMAATNIATTFSGVPNNGNITIKAKRGDMTASTVPSFYTNSALSITDDNWSLLGNPYPSAINGLQFLQTNASNLIGTLYLWRHLNNPALIASPFYQNFTYNYNSSDYLGVNYTGTTTPGASDIIKSGQAFMVQRIEGAQDLTGVDVVFNNAMRLNVGVPYANNNFYRNAIQIDSQNNNQHFTNLERHRIWLDIIDDTTMLSETTLLGYVQGATQNIDNLFDGPLAISNTTQIYSIQDNQNLIIQGRALPFEVYDEVQLGVNVVSNGNYKIALNTVDGLFESQNIYLEDKLLNITHDMKMAPYNFTSEIGIFNDRFIMKYANTSLAINQFETSNDFRITTGQKLTLFSSNQNIKKVEIFDLLGRKIDEYKNLNTKNLVLENLLKSNKIYIIKTTFENHSVIAKKVIF